MTGTAHSDADQKRGGLRSHLNATFQDTTGKEDDRKQVLSVEIDDYNDMAGLAQSLPESDSIPNSLNTDHNGQFSAAQTEGVRRDNGFISNQGPPHGLLSATSITSLGHPESYRAPTWKLLTAA